jgi:hypothetical protein
VDHERTEPRLAQQLDEAGEHRGLLGRLGLRAGLADGEVGAQDHRGARDTREREGRAPAGEVDQEAAEARREQGAERCEHRQVRDRFDEAAGAVDVTRDGASERHTASRADRLDEAPDKEAGERTRERRDHATDQEQRKADQQHRPAAIAVGIGAVEQRRERHPEDADAEGQLRQ